jgi:hypothetical protein
MFSKKVAVMILAIATLVPCASAIELRMKYEEGQSRSMSVKIDLRGSLEVRGGSSIDGNVEGSGGVNMDLKVLSVDEKGVASIENRLGGFNVNLNGNADLGDATHAFAVKLDENGGAFTSDGKTEEIPAAAMEEAKAQAWTVQMDSLGATVGMSLDSEKMEAAEAENIKNLSDSLAGVFGQNGLLPKEDVEVGQTWEQVFKVDDITKELSKENPMLATMANLGIPDLISRYTLTEVGQDGDNEMATISSTVDFSWLEGSLPLGIVNITVNKLALKSESLVEMNNTAGYAPRMTGVTTIDFDLAINTLLGPSGPANYEAKGQLKTDSTIVTK